MSIPVNYLERVYAGVLGKIIGVYLGRPIENWNHERIITELGEVQYYVNEKLNKILVVPDDDISGTFTFIKALPDYYNSRQITPAQIGQTWLNYLIEGRTILWWGGKGNSTEHTAFLNLKNGIKAPLSGSAETNGKVVSEQIGAQIFIDGWAMVAPGDPEFAADLARRAASVSHDGEAMFAAQLLAAMEAQAFVEPNLDRLLDTGLSLIPSSSSIFRLVNELRDLRIKEPDWYKTRAWIADKYGYDKYPGNCHIIPNHALIQLALLYGNDDFQKSLMIVNTSGWDTDCNSGNVGCLLGIKNGLEGIDNGPNWRGPVADRLYLSSADSGSAITDATSVAYSIANIGRAINGEPKIAPKGGRRFHFDLPGSMMGFQSFNGSKGPGGLNIENVSGHSLEGNRSLALRYIQLAPGQVACAATPTFIPLEMAGPPGNYNLQASPTLYPGQTIKSRVSADLENKSPVICSIFIARYTPQDELEITHGPGFNLDPGNDHIFAWRIPDQEGGPICEAGIEISSLQPANGTIYLDHMTWDGAPEMALTRPPSGGVMWRRAWVDGIDQFIPWTGSPGPMKLVQNRGRGLLIQGTREWTDYQVEAVITPQLANLAGIAIRVQGMGRYYALLICADQQARLVKVLDGEQVLGETDFTWEFYEPVSLRLQAVGSQLQGWVNDRLLFDCVDSEHSLEGGGIGLVCEQGCISCGSVLIRPASSGSILPSSGNPING